MGSIGGAKTRRRHAYRPRGVRSIPPLKDDFDSPYQGHFRDIRRASSAQGNIDTAPASVRQTVIETITRAEMATFLEFFEDGARPHATFGAAGRRTQRTPSPHTRPYQVALVHPGDSYRSTLSAYLRRQGFRIVEFEDPHAAVENVVDDDRYDVIVGDADDPSLRAIDVLLRLKDLGVAIPIAFLTTKRDDANEELALESGAADYLSKSRSLSIIARRLRLLVDGAKAPDLSASDRIDQDHENSVRRLRLRSHRAQWAGREVPLTVTEFRIVRLLATHAGDEVRYRQIYDVVHGIGFYAGDGEDGYRTNVRSLIRKVRQKFCAIDPLFAEIQNRPGVGYCWRKRDFAPVAGKKSAAQSARARRGQGIRNG
jgi:two-component system response regulator ChvI